METIRYWDYDKFTINSEAVRDGFFKDWTRAEIMVWMMLFAYYPHQPTYLQLEHEAGLSKYQASKAFKSLEKKGIVLSFYSEQYHELQYLLAEKDAHIAPRKQEPSINYGLTSAKYKAFARDGYKCTRCGTTEKLCAHHIKPLEHYTDNTVENLVILCASCHGKAHAGRRKHKRERRPFQMVSL